MRASPRRAAVDGDPQHRLRDVRRRLVAYGVEGLTSTVGRLPLPVLRPLVCSLARPVMRRRLGARARDNLRVALGDRLTEREREAVLDEMFTSFARLPAELAAYARLGPRFLDRHVDDQEALAFLHPFERSWRRGFIGITGHMGNWELLGQWFKQRGLQPMSGILVKRQPNPHLNRLIEKIRGRHGMATLYTDDSAQAIVRILESGGSIGLAADQDVIALPGIFVDFFGRPAYTPVGPARLALAARVPLLLALALRTPDGFRVRINPPVWPDPSRPRRAEIRRLTEEWSRQLEGVIREHPGQWAWFHRRWRTTRERIERYRKAGLKPDRD